MKKNSDFCFPEKYIYSGLPKHGRLLMEKCSFANCGSCFGELLNLYNCQIDITGLLRYLKVWLTGFVRKKQTLFCTDQVCLMLRNHADDQSWYARVIAIHLTSTGNPVLRINANIRYITGIVKQTEGLTSMFPWRYSFSSKSLFLLEVVSLNSNFL